MEVSGHKTHSMLSTLSNMLFFQDTKEKRKQAAARKRSAGAWEFACEWVGVLGFDEFSQTRLEL